MFRTLSGLSKVRVLSGASMRSATSFLFDMPLPSTTELLVQLPMLLKTALVGRSFCSGVCGSFGFRAGRKQFQQHGVTLPFEFCDRAAVSLLQHAVDNGLLHFGTEFSDRAE